MTEALRALAHRALEISHAPLQRYALDVRYEKREGIVFSRSTLLGGPHFNKITVFNLDLPAERVLALADEFFAGPGSYGVLIDADLGHPLEHLLRARDYRVDDEEPGMVLPSIPTPPAPPPNLTIRRVTDEVTLYGFWYANDPPPPVPGRPREALAPEPFTNLTQFFNPSLACALDPDIALFAGYVDGRPVACSALYRVGEIAEIGAVGTMPAYRNRGIGAAMTWAAIAEGAARGCTTAALRASHMGFPVYRRMGFQTACTLRMYVPA
jgi:GNAT superfamily N-acetyltransferase